jgi:hypothetical protein
MMGSKNSEAEARATMHRAYATFVSKLGFKWADEVEAIAVRNEKMMREFEKEQFYANIETDPRSTKDLICKDEVSAPVNQKAAPQKGGYLAKFKERRQKKVVADAE